MDWAAMLVPALQHWKLTIGVIAIICCFYSLDLPNMETH